MLWITVLNPRNEPQGPFTREQIDQKLQAGEFTPDSLAHTEGLNEWTPLGEVLARADAMAPRAADYSPKVQRYLQALKTPMTARASEEAEIGSRFLAMVIDYALLIPPLLFIIGRIAAYWGYDGAVVDWSDDRGRMKGTFIEMRAWIDFVGLVIPWLYFALLESSRSQATFGKWVMGIYVTDMNGGRIGFWKATLRYFSKILSACILYVGFIMAAFTANKQALHDIIAGTLVIRK